MSRTYKITTLTYKKEDEKYCRSEILNFGRRMKPYTKNGIRGKYRAGSGARSVTLVNNYNIALKKQCRTIAKRQIQNELQHIDSSYFVPINRIINNE
jgi:hypothetical protein